MALTRTALWHAGGSLGAWAETASRGLLREQARRWRHVCGVAAQARRIAAILDEWDRPYLEAAAYLHDVGYSEALRRCGAHQLDGARFLRESGEERLARLVAHHSEARHLLQLTGLGTELELYPPEVSAVADALTYCDLTTGPDGQRTTPSERMAEVDQRYGGGSVIVQAQELARPALMEAVARTEERLQLP